MLCPKCGSLRDKVIDSRMSRAGDSIRRRRVCLTCNYRFTTYETIEEAIIRIRKRDGRVEPFDRKKLRASFEKSCEKRPVSDELIDKCVGEIYAALEADHRAEIPSQEIGLRVMTMLQAIDPVSYVRYASVYRQFREVGDFIEEIQTLKKLPFPDENQKELFPKL